MSGEGTQGLGPAAEPMTVRPAGRGRRRTIIRWVVGLVLVLVISIVGYAVFQYLNLSMGIKRSNILGGKGSTMGDTNILIMRLSSPMMRIFVSPIVDPLPPRMFDLLIPIDKLRY